MAKLSQANIAIFKELLIASLGENTPYQATLNFLEEKLKGLISEEQRVQVLTNVLSTITTQFTIQAMESSRALSLEDLLFEKKLELMNKEIEKAQAQIDLAKGELGFNRARTQLVAAQTESEGEKKKNIVRERSAMDDQLRIKEAEFLTNAVFGFGAGGLQTPQGLLESMLKAIKKITQSV